MTRLKTLACIAVLLFSLNLRSQKVTLRQIGTETVLFSDVFLEYFGGNLYTIENTGALYKTDLATGSHTRLGNATYKHTKYFFAVNYQLYCIEDDGSMNRIDPVTGAWTVVSPIGEWKTIDFAFSVGGRMFATQNGALYTYPTLREALKKQIGEAEFFDMGRISKSPTMLYSVIGGNLSSIDPQTGKWKSIGKKKDYKFVKDAEPLGDKMYTIETPSSLFVTDLNTGAKTLVDDTQFKNAVAIFNDGGKLYAIFNEGQLYEVVLPQ